MKVLFITRKVDRNDAMAGFTYGWIRELASQVKELHVMCLEMGNTTGLPTNCHVYSLGKERGKNRWREFWCFQTLAARIVSQVDAVIGHQNPEYTLLVAPWCKLHRTLLTAWYVHKAVTWKTRLLVRLADIIFTASKESFRLPSSKVVVLHHGIDTNKFSFRPKPSSDCVIMSSVSRLSPSKRIEQIIDIAVVVHKQCKKPVELRIYGDSILSKEKKYVESLRTYIANQRAEDYISLRGQIAHRDLPEALYESDIMLNYSQTGSLDKAVLEAMACGTIVVTNNEAFYSFFGNIGIDLYVDNKDAFVQKVLEIISINDRLRIQTELRNQIVRNHNLEDLISQIISRVEEFKKY